MKAILMTAAGGADVLKLADIPLPELPSPQHIRVKLSAAGINPIDTKLRKNPAYYPDNLPCVLGCDGAGVVEFVGAEVHRFAPGDEVYFFNGGLGDEPGHVHEGAYVLQRWRGVHHDQAAVAPGHAQVTAEAGVGRGREIGRAHV